METRHEVEVDTQLAELHGQHAKVLAALASNKLSLANHAGIRAEYVTRNRREVRQSVEEILEVLNAKLDSGEVESYNERAARESIAKRETLEAERQAIRAAMLPLNAEYEAAPWSRFFLVQNHGGHIHSSMHCSTCRFTTVFAWLPTLSGLTEKDAVEAHGAILCTVCYPSAPVEWTRGATEADPDQCPGSGTYDIVEGTYKRYGYTGNGRGKCQHCDSFQGVTTTGKIRKHKRGQS